MNENKPIIPDEIISPDCDIDRSHKNIPIETIIEYRNRGLSYTEIAKLTGCSRQNVQQRLEAVGYDKEDLENFKKHRGDVFAFLQSKLLNSIDLHELKEISPIQRIVGTGILFDKERLQRGESTENVNVFELEASIEEYRKKRLELLKRVLCRVEDKEIQKMMKTHKNT